MAQLTAESIIQIAFNAIDNASKVVDTIDKRSGELNETLKDQTKSNKALADSTRKVVGEQQKQVNSQKDLSGVITKTIKTVTALVAALGAANLLRAISRVIIETNQHTDALAKQADKLGVTIDELQAYRLAAELSGVANNTAEMALQRFIRRTAEAAQGLGEAKGALKELNLDPDELLQKSPVEALEDVADALSQVESQNDRVRLSFKLFDSEGVALLNLLQNGAGTLVESRQLLDEPGLSMSRIDAAQVEHANDQWTKMNAILNGINQRLGVEMAPVLAAVAEVIIKSFREGGNMASFFEEMITGSVVAVDRLGLAAQVMSGVFLNGLQGILIVLSQLGLGVIKQVEMQQEGIENLLRFLISNVQTFIGENLRAVEAFFNYIVSFANLKISNLTSLVNGTVGLATDAVSLMVNVAIDRLNRLIALANSVPGLDFNTVSSVDLQVPDIKPPTIDQTKIGKAIFEGLEGALEQAESLLAQSEGFDLFRNTSNGLETFIDESSQQAIDRSEAVADAFKKLFGDGGDLVAQYNSKVKELNQLLDNQKNPSNGIGVKVDKISLDELKSRISTAVQQAVSNASSVVDTLLGREFDFGSTTQGVIDQYASEEAQIRAKYARERTIILNETRLTEEEKQALLARSREAEAEALFAANEIAANTRTSFIDGLSSSFEGLINQTMTWQQALWNISKTIGTQLIQDITKMAATWIQKNILMQGMMKAGSALSSAIRKKDVAENAIAAQAKTAANMPAATSASIGSFGAAALIGIAAVVAAMAALPSFNTGGYTGSGNRYQTAGVVEFEEYVNTANSTRLNRPFLEYANRPGNDLNNLFNAAASNGFTRGTEVGLSQAVAPNNAPPVTVVIVDSREQAENIAAREDGYVTIQDLNNALNNQPS